MTTNEKVIEVLLGEIDRLREELIIWKRIGAAKKFSDSVPAYKVSGINFPKEKEEEPAPF